VSAASTLLLDLAYLVAAGLYLPLLLFQAVFRGQRRRGWRERLGSVRRRPGTRPCIWVHGVSLGEINATRSLVAEIERRLPKYEVVISATTQTGHDAAMANYGPRYVFRYPLDFSWVVRRVLDRIRPDAIVLMELEVWPNLIAEATRRGVVVCVANGRVTAEKSMRRFSWPVIRHVARRMFAQLAWVGAQDETYADRFRRLGVPAERVVVTGSVKYDTALLADSVPGADALAQRMEIDPAAPLWVAGSTGPLEESLVLDAWRALRSDHPELQLAIVPRKPERFEEVAALIEAAGFECVRRTGRPDLAGQDLREEERRRRHASYRAGDKAPAGTNAKPRVLLGDTMGELRKFYSLANVVFVGRTLAPLGGSDVMEVAGLGKPMIVGPHTENFAEPTERLLAARAAVRIGDHTELANAVARLLDDEQAAQAIGAAARDVVKQNVGATRRTVDLLCEQFNLVADHPPSSIATARVESIPGE